MILESSTGRDKIAEHYKDFSPERFRSPEVPVEEEAVKNEEDDDLIFRKMNISWLSDKTSTLQKGVCIDSNIENLHKTVKQ